MKKLTIATILLLALSVAPVMSQTLSKGNLMGIHTLTVNLDPDVTMNQYKQYIKTKMIPAWEKHFEMKVYLLQSQRGADANSLGVAFIYASEEIRDKYWGEDGSPTALWQEKSELVQEITDGANKLGTWTSTYNDWLVN